MKQYTHAWLAFMAIKRLEKAKIVFKKNSRSTTNAPYQEAAQSLVKWFKDYRDFVIKGAWYPDEVFKDNLTSHIIKHEPMLKTPMTRERKPLIATSEMLKFAEKSGVYGCDYKITTGNCADRCEAFSHSIVDSLKMQFLESKGNPVSPTNNHIAIRFFILSHYIADCHMPLHCDSRKFSDGADIHALIEKDWEDKVLESYELDGPNLRFFYDPQGYPLKKTEINPLLKSIEEAIESVPLIYEWPDGSGNAWDYMSNLSHYSYYMAYLMFPDGFSMSTSTKTFKASETFKKLDEYSYAILFDAIDSIARIWLHAWHRFVDWNPYKQELEKQAKYEEYLAHEKKKKKEASEK